MNNPVWGVSRLITLFHFTSFVGGIKIISLDWSLNLLPKTRFTGFFISNSKILIFKN